LPEFQNVVTIEMLDDLAADINKMMTSDGRFCPKTIDASMEASDEFLGLLNTFMKQKLLLAKKCVEMSNFAEDLHALTALALTPALIMTITTLLVCYSEELFPAVPIISTVIMHVSDELKPFIHFCIIPLPLYLYFLYTC